ncbi:hypothetical protein I4U23_003857 [Adineta vaga]|nr:hypothetical protein I4U23_003857 [Adineta vaga]
MGFEDSRNKWSVRISPLSTSINYIELAQELHLSTSRVFIPKTVNDTTCAWINDFNSEEEAITFVSEWSRAVVLGQRIRCVTSPPRNERKSTLHSSQESLAFSNESSRNHLSVSDSNSDRNIFPHRETPKLPSTRNLMKQRTAEDKHSLCRYANKGKCRERSNECKYRHQRCSHYDSCTNLKCELAHAEKYPMTPIFASTTKLKNKRSKPCINGVTCYKVDCTFAHPDEWSPCMDGEKCNNYECTRNHPRKRRGKCHAGSHCRLNDCKYLHPTTHAETSSPLIKLAQTDYPIFELDDTVFHFNLDDNRPEDLCFDLADSARVLLKTFVGSVFNNEDIPYREPYRIELTITNDNEARLSLHYHPLTWYDRVLSLLSLNERLSQASVYTDTIFKNVSSSNQLIKVDKTIQNLSRKVEDRPVEKGLQCQEMIHILSADKKFNIVCGALSNSALFIGNPLGMISKSKYQLVSPMDGTRTVLLVPVDHVTNEMLICAQDTWYTIFIAINWLRRQLGVKICPIDSIIFNYGSLQSVKAANPKLQECHGQICLNLTYEAINAAKSIPSLFLLHDCYQDPFEPDINDANALQSYRIIPEQLQILSLNASNEID